MDSDRRNPETASLRRYFKVQLARITALMDNYASRRRASRQRGFLEAEAIESVVKATDTRLRTVASYRKRLRSGVRALLDYVEQLVDSLPPPIEINQQSFLCDQRVNAFFVNKASIRELFSRSPELQDFFSDPENGALEQAYAILFMARNEKEVFSSGLADGLLVRDIRQTTISFTDHVISQPRASETELRSALRQILFKKYVGYIDYELALLNAALGRSVLNSPSIYLDALERTLEKPEELLRLQSNIIHVNRVGFRVAEDSKEAVNKFTLYELGLGDRSYQSIALVSYPRAEMESRDALLRAAELSLQ